MAEMTQNIMQASPLIQTDWKEFRHGLFRPCCQVGGGPPVRTFCGHLQAAVVLAPGFGTMRLLLHHSYTVLRAPAVTCRICMARLDQHWDPSNGMLADA